MSLDSITCPECKMTSHHPEDVKWGWCGNCKAYTSPVWRGDHLLLPSERDELNGRGEFKRRIAAAYDVPLALVDGTWQPAEPLPYLGWKAKTEDWCRRHGLRRTAAFLAWWDERGLG